MLYPEKGDLSEPHRVRSGIHLENHLECFCLVISLTYFEVVAYLGNQLARNFSMVGTAT